MHQINKIGIYGGTFDPIHIGHLRLAIEVLERLNLDQIRLIPCANPPHRSQPLFSTKQRLHMAQIACKNVQGLIVDDYEMVANQTSSKPSWTINTLKYMRQKYPEVGLYLLLGADSFADFMNWQNRIGMIF